MCLFLGERKRHCVCVCVCVSVGLHVNRNGEIERGERQSKVDERDDMMPAGVEDIPLAENNSRCSTR